MELLGICTPKKLTVALAMHASSKADSRSSSALSARLRYLLDWIIVIAPCYSLLERADELYFIEKMSALRSFLVPQTVAVTKTLRILMPQERISFNIVILSFVKLLLF